MIGHNTTTGQYQPYKYKELANDGLVSEVVRVARCHAGASQPAADTDGDDEGAKRDDHKDIGSNGDMKVDDSSCGF